MRTSIRFAKSTFGYLVVTAMCFGGRAEVYGQTRPVATVPAATTTTAPSLKELQADRLKYAMEVLTAVEAQYNAGVVEYNQVAVAMKLVLESRLDMAETKAQRLEAAQRLLSMCETLVTLVEGKVKIGATTASSLSLARYELADIRVRLAKIQAEL